MPEKLISPKTYVIVCVALISLTFLTVGASFIQAEGVWRIAIGLVIAVAKASLVVLFFMHALISDRLTWLVIAVSGFWLGILVVLTLTDYFTRHSVLFMPGH